MGRAAADPAPLLMDKSYPGDLPITPCCLPIAPDDPPSAPYCPPSARGGRRLLTSRPPRRRGRSQCPDAGLPRPLSGRTLAAHELKPFLVRLHFCLFAGDNGIFPTKSFQCYLADHTAADGSDLGPRFSPCLSEPSVSSWKSATLLTMQQPSEAVACAQLLVVLPKPIAIRLRFQEPRSLFQS